MSIVRRTARRASGRTTVRRAIAIALLSAMAFSATAYADPPVPDGVPPVPSGPSVPEGVPSPSVPEGVPSAPAVPDGVPSAPGVPQDVPSVPPVPSGVPSLPPVPSVTPPAPSAASAPSCEPQADAGATANAATPLPRTAAVAICGGAVAGGSSPEADAADWYWFRVTSSTASIAIVVRPADGGDVDTQMIGAGGQVIAPSFRGGVDQPHVFVLDAANAVPGTYRIGIFPGRDGTVSPYTIAAAVPEL